MMIDARSTTVIYDDRELINAKIKSYVGATHYGDIIFRRYSLLEQFKSVLPKNILLNFYHIRDTQHLVEVKMELQRSIEYLNHGIFIISSKAITDDLDLLRSLIERLQFGKEDFVDRTTNPLIVFFNNAHTFMNRFELLERAPTFSSDASFEKIKKIKSIDLLDLSKINDFLKFSKTSSQSRHFNNLDFDNLFYTKSSSDKSKIHAEYSYYNFVPEHMRPWLIEPFDFKNENNKSSYKMLRYYVPDVAFQWINNTFTPDDFNEFLNRVLFFIKDRPTKDSSKSDCESFTNKIYYEKTEQRINQFLNMSEGKSINSLLKNANNLGLEEIFSQYSSLYQLYKKNITTKNLVVGHGDLCFSNILYDKNIFLLKFIDPRGAETADQLWTHPLYDLAKLSHSILGDYDLINNNLIKAEFSSEGFFKLKQHNKNYDNFKVLFINKVSQMGLDIKTLRLAESSLFLSMLPMHIDFPNKTMAFILRAKQILDEIEF